MGTKQTNNNGGTDRMASQRRHNRRRKTKGRFRALYQVLSILLILIAVTAGCIVFSG